MKSTDFFFFLEEWIEKNNIKVHEFIELHISWFRVMIRGNKSLLDILIEAGTLRLSHNLKLLQYL